MEKLTLPEPARSLWRAKRDIIHNLPRQLAGASAAPHLGGGTMLAARWKHRASTDIDIVLPGRRTLIDLIQDNDANIVRRLGGRAEATRGSRIKIGFDEGEIDLSTLRPSPSLGQQQASVDGRNEIVLSNAQILRGKLARADQLLVRDIVDVLVAAKRDPGALATAASLIGAQDAKAITVAWRAANWNFSDQFDRRIHRLDPACSLQQGSLGTDAAKALEDHRYDRLEIEVAARTIMVRKTIKGSRLGDEHYDRADIAGALIESGVGGHLDENGPITAAQLSAAIHQRVATVRGPVYDSDDPASVKRVIQNAGLTADGQRSTSTGETGTEGPGARRDPDKGRRSVSANDPSVPAPPERPRPASTSGSGARDEKRPPGNDKQPGQPGSGYRRQ